MKLSSILVGLTTASLTLGAPTAELAKLKTDSLKVRVAEPQESSFRINKPTATTAKRAKEEAYSTIWMHAVADEQEKASAMSKRNLPVNAKRAEEEAYHVIWILSVADEQEKASAMSKRGLPANAFPARVDKKTLRMIQDAKVSKSKLQSVIDQGETKCNLGHSGSSSAALLLEIQTV